MVDQDLLDLLVCPETRQPVRQADPELLARLNAAVAAGTLTNRAGDAVVRPLEGGLVRDDDAVIYPIRDDIPIMLIDEAIPLPGAADSDPSPAGGR